ncbi:MAG: hypothetical protein K9J17_04385 [Flavobacteriales bacterium]|nr:hypothetical protein [Flavobacteriales bacterium]
MKTLIIKLVLLTISVTSFTQLAVNHINVSRYKNFDPARFNYLNENLEEYNVYFVGSSRFGRQIHPVLFDSLNTDLGYHSYNYSFDAAYAPTTINLAEELIDKIPDDLKMLILELSPLEFSGNMDADHIARTIPWYTLEDFLFLAQSTHLLTPKISEQLRLWKNQVYLFTYNVLDIGEFWKRLKLSLNHYISDSREILCSTEVISDHKEIVKLQASTIANLPEQLATYDLNLTNSPYLRRVNSLQKKCTNQHIELILVVTPKMQQPDIRYIESLAKLIDQDNVIRVNDSKEYSQYYTIEYASDADHLNNKAVNLYTSNISSSIRNLTMKNQIKSIREIP